LDNLINLQKEYKRLAHEYLSLYKYDYNNRIISDIDVFEKIKFTNVSKFCINKIVIDIPFDVNDLNKLYLPAKTLVFFLHPQKMSKEKLLDFDLGNENLIKLDSIDVNKIASTKNPTFNPNILQITNDAFFSKFQGCHENDNNFDALLTEIQKIINKKGIKTNNKNSNLSNNNAYEDFKILSLIRSNENLFIEFDTQSKDKQLESDVKLLGICFLKDYDLPNIIHLKPFYHLGQMITSRLVNQNILIPNIKPSSIDVGSITFYGEEFKM